MTNGLTPELLRKVAEVIEANSTFYRFYSIEPTRVLRFSLDSNDIKRVEVLYLAGSDRDNAPATMAMLEAIRSKSGGYAFCQDLHASYIDCVIGDERTATMQRFKGDSLAHAVALAVVAVFGEGS